MSVLGENIGGVRAQKTAGYHYPEARHLPNLDIHGQPDVSGTKKYHNKWKKRTQVDITVLSNRAEALGRETVRVKVKARSSKNKTPNRCTLLCS